MSQLDFIRVKDPERIAELAIFAEGIFREYFSTLHEPAKVDYLVNHTLSLETLTTAIADEGYEYYFVDDAQTGGISVSSASGPMTASSTSASSTSSRERAAGALAAPSSSS